MAQAYQNATAETKERENKRIKNVFLLSCLSLFILSGSPVSPPNEQNMEDSRPPTVPLHIFQTHPLLPYVESCNLYEITHRDER